MPHPTYNGSALPVYSVDPNWKEPISLRTIYNTIVKEALDLGEERQGRVPRSLFGIRYQTLPLTGQATGYIRRVMELAQALPIVMPVWTEPSKLMAGVGIGATTLLTDDTSPTLFSVLHDYVIIWQDYKTWEVLAISALAALGDSITLADATTRAYPAGTLIYPILIGKLPRAESKNITDEHGVASPDFEETFNGLTDQSVVEQILPTFESFLTYTDECRAEFVVTFPDMLAATVYVLEISDAPGGPFVPHIYFALQTSGEIASKTKVLTVNNDYNGGAFFRISSVADGEILTLAGTVLASVVAPPVISLANLSEITSNLLGNANELVLPGAMDGLRTLEFYSNGGFVIPYSAIEDPLTFTSFTYRRFQKKYALRQWSWGHWGTLVAEGNQNQPTTVTGPVGATIKWTRDNSDPTLATPAPLPYGGVANNAFAIDDAFCGIIKARCFSGGCRSPLAMVAVDKVMYERPNFRTQGPANDSGGYCDKPNPVDGSESGNSCNLIFGGQCGFETANYAAGTSGGSTASSSNDPSGHGATLRKRTKNLSDSTYIGWPVHGSHSSYYEFLTTTWNDNFNHWHDAPRIHNWALVVANPEVIPPFLGVLETAVDRSLCGNDVTTIADRAWWDTVRTSELAARMPLVPVPVCNISLNHFIYADRFDVLRSPLYWQEMRNLYWVAPDFTAPPPASDPLPPPAVVNPYDDFQVYVDGDATVQTLNFRTGTDWDNSWTVRDGLAQTNGFDTFEAYANGAVPEHSTHPDGDGYTYFSGGEAWEPGTTNEWIFRDGELAKVYKDEFESYANGPTPFDMHGGNGWAADENWVAANDLIGGDEAFETYSNGAFVGAASGTNWIASEAWQAR